jgi:hypothetical protein
MWLAEFKPKFLLSRSITQEQVLGGLVVGGGAGVGGGQQQLDGVLVWQWLIREL